MIIDTICEIVPLYHITYDARSVPFRPMLQKTFYLNDETDTCALGKALAHVLERGLTIYLHGDLGAGKTTLTRALIREAGHTEKVKSPTYTLMEPYVINLNGQAVELLHFDLYRMGCPEEFLEAGFREHFNGTTICIIEWAENAGSELPAPDIAVTLDITGDGRTAHMSASSGKGMHCLETLRFSPHC